MGWTVEWYNTRWKTMHRKQCIGFLILILLACGSLCSADKSTLERMRKHQEWLKRRNQQKSNNQSTLINPKFQSVNLWRFNKPSLMSKNTQINEVYYAENETTTTTTTTTDTPSTTTATGPTLTATTMGSPAISTTTETPTILAATTPTASLTTESVERQIVEWPVTTNAPSLMTGGKLSTTSTTTTISASRANTSAMAIDEIKSKPKVKPRSYPRWGNWGKWSNCSRSCGGGVMYQQRRCINRNSSTGKRYISDDCTGVHKRYQLCNENACTAGEADFRSQQCSSHNDIDFDGVKYEWVPYIKNDAECELNCKPMNMPYYALMNATVIDGTECYRSAEYLRSNFRGRSICVDGICKAVLSNGAIAGLATNNGAVSCGGLLCRPITGIFTRDPLPEDAYVHVTFIPIGASNLTITELGNSHNLLVLRTSDDRYIFNGDNKASTSGAYEAAETIFDYHRIDGLKSEAGVTEWVTCLGPIMDTLELMIFSKSSNPGIKYEYLLPIVSESEENEVSMESDGFLKAAPEDVGGVGSSRSTRRRKYNWKVVGFSSCTKSCGGGTQTPLVRCVRENPVRYYSQRRCMHSEKPVLNENLLRCNTQPCPAYWRIDEWGECRCHQGEGYREREISCVQELASGIVIHVDNSGCMEEQPAIRKSCDCPKSRRRVHGRYRVHGTNGTYHNRMKSDKAGVWLISDWNQYCATDCGPGVEYRTIFCDRSKPNTDRCDVRSTPDITRPCESDRPCSSGEWFTGPWSACNGNCFNLTRTRSVLCIQNQLIMEDEDCRPELKPQAMEKCLHEEVEYCGPKWHYSEWSECSKTCDGGTQRRSVKCLEYDEKDNVLRDSSKCRYAIREPIFRSCNSHKCEAEPQLELLQNDGTASSSCVDEFSNCQWAVKAKLCSYEYYQQNCCHSCEAGQ